MNEKTNRKYSEQRKLRRRVIAVSIITLIGIYSLGVAFGCFVYSVIKPEKVSAYELVVQPTPEPAEEVDPVLALCSIPYQCGKRVLDVALVRVMVDKCNEYGVPFALALAIAEQESGFNPDAISSTNDYGLMQINKCNFGWLRKSGIEPLDHKGNITAGVFMISQAINKYGDYNKALMAYNCGDAGAKRLWKNGVYSTAYSRSVMERYNKWVEVTKGV